MQRCIIYRISMKRYRNYKKAVNVSYAVGKYNKWDKNFTRGPTIG